MDITKFAPNKLEYLVIDMPQHVSKGKNRLGELSTLLDDYAQAGWKPYKELTSIKALILVRREQDQRLEAYWDTLEDGDAEEDEEDEDEDFDDE